PTLCFVLEVLGPGLLVVKHRIREDSAKFRNVAVFEGEEVKILSREAVDVSRHHPLMRSLLGPEPAVDVEDPVDVVLRLAVSMRAHKRGGTLLMVPAGTGSWRQSIVHPLSYGVTPPFTELAELADGIAVEGQAQSYAALSKSVEALAGLTAVDGATLITDRYE